MVKRIRTRRGRPFTKDNLAKDIRQVREKLGIPSELKLADLRRTAWTEMANKGATVPELAASAGIAYAMRSSTPLVRARVDSQRAQRVV